MRISLNIQAERPKWWYKIFSCRHEIVRVESNPFERYGIKESYLMCIKCGRHLSRAQDNCKHKENCFGTCIWCNKRLSHFEDDHKHDWVKDCDTDDEFCRICGGCKSDIYYSNGYGND
jgi:hypothetical protein